MTHDETALLPDDIKKAKAILGELCRREFKRTMSIPVDEVRDFDCILARVIRAAEAWEGLCSGGAALEEKIALYGDKHAPWNEAGPTAQATYRKAARKACAALYIELAEAHT